MKMTSKRYDGQRHTARSGISIILITTHDNHNNIYSNVCIPYKLCCLCKHMTTKTVLHN